MKDPERLSDRSADDLGAVLLRSLRADAPSGASRKRAMAGALSAATALKATSGVAATSLVGSVAAWALSGALLGGAVSGGAIWLRSQVAARHAEPAAATVPAMSRAPRQAATPPEAPAPIASSSPKPALPARSNQPPEARQPRPARHRTSPAAQSIGQSPAGTVGDLRAQRMAIEAARRMLAEGHTADALSALDAYRARFRKPMFGQEAAVLRIQALVQNGDNAGARKLGQAFLAAHADSPLAEHVRSLTGLQSPGR